MKTEALTEASIVQTTKRIVRETGFSTVSMRQIATELNITATALYYYFKDKTALLEAVAFDIFKDIKPEPATKPWEKRLQSLLQIQQEAFFIYPGLARFLLIRRQYPAAQIWSETILEILEDAGFGAQHIGKAFAMLVFFINPLTFLDDPANRNATLLDDGINAAKNKSVDQPLTPRFKRLLENTNMIDYGNFYKVALEGIIIGLKGELELIKQAAAPEKIKSVNRARSKTR